MLSCRVRNVRTRAVAVDRQVADAAGLARRNQDVLGAVGEEAAQQQQAVRPAAPEGVGGGSGAGASAGGERIPLGLGV